MNEITQEEIELAIVYWEEFEREIDEMPYSEILEAQRKPVKIAITALRAELTRQENAPLTIEDVVSEAYDRGYNLGYSDGYQDGTKGGETE